MDLSPTFEYLETLPALDPRDRQTLKDILSGLVQESLPLAADLEAFLLRQADIVGQVAVLTARYVCAVDPLKKKRDEAYAILMSELEASGKFTGSGKISMMKAQAESSPRFTALDKVIADFNAVAEFLSTISNALTTRKDLFVQASITRRRDEQ